MYPLVAPSILAADFANLQRDVEMLNVSEADYIHVDVMDGVFVPNISFGIPVTYLAAFRKAGADSLTVHVEATDRLSETLNEIRSLGAKAGVAINPESPISLLKEVVLEVDLICVMSVNPGFGGQKFMETSYAKVSELKELLLRKGSKAKIEVDGGIGDQQASRLIQAGADILVAGSYIFKANDPLACIADLKRIK
ncbi:MAG: ribulose-phosphate 3-epimerase [Algoriphagus sp.]|nr:ribulose-phosphate 3-epimerase [Algoriphagus sp.]